MRAITFDKRLKFDPDYPKPEARSGEALVKVSMAGICATDTEIIKGYMGFTGVPGHEFSGVVAECEDSSYTGRRVVGEINIGCDSCSLCAQGKRNHCPNRSVLGILAKDGAFADYLTLPTKNLHLLPDSITDEEAVFVEPLAAAFEITKQVGIDRSTSVCVIGDGKLGLLVAQVINLDAGRLVVAGRHAYKLKILSERGIATTLNANELKRDFDVTVDCTGSQSGIEAATRLTRPAGTIVLKTTVAERSNLAPGWLNSVVIDELTVVGSRCGPFAPAIKALAEKTVDVKALIDNVYPIEEGVEAFESAKKHGVLKTLIKMQDTGRQ